MSATTATDRGAAGLHLSTMIGLADAEVYFYLWTAPDKRTYWFRPDDLEEAADQAMRLAEAGQNVYVGISLSRAARGDYERVTNDTAAGLVGLIADIDILSPAHARADLPTTLDHARRLLAKVPLTPTLLVSSGHGLQAWWLFKEPWLFQNDAERRDAADLLDRWIASWQERAKRHGWWVDPTRDLARLLRLAGTINQKPGREPVPVAWLDYQPQHRYIPEDFEPYLIADSDADDRGGGDRQRADDADFEPADPTRVVEGCAWLRHCREDARTLDEPNWYAMLSIIARCEGGQALAHQWSRPYPNYTQDETEAKIAHAMNGAGPRTCQNIRHDLGNERHCGACPHYPRNTSPITLGRSYATFREDGQNQPAPAPDPSADPLPDGAIPNSQPLKGLGIGNGPVKVWERMEPGPRQWHIAGLMPAGATTILYGDGGQGKSLLAILIAICVATGRPFLGRETRRATVLFIDAELDVDEFLRRAYAVARGLGLTRPPEGLYYWKLPGSLINGAVHQEAEKAVKDCGAGLVILDSLTVAAHGSDVTEAEHVTSIMKALEKWGTVLAIDHIRTPQPGTNLSDYRPFGSAFKHNLARSTIQVIQAEGGGLMLTQKKSNFGPMAEPLTLTLDFDEDAIRFTTIGAGDDQLEGIERHLLAVERVARALAEHPEGIAPEALAGDLDMKPKTVRNYLTKLRKAGRVEPLHGERWRPVPSPNPLSDSERGNGGAA